MTQAHSDKITPTAATTAPTALPLSYKKHVADQAV